jgi:hypothetical protein
MGPGSTRGQISVIVGAVLAVGPAGCGWASTTTTPDIATGTQSTTDTHSAATTTVPAPKPPHHRKPSPIPSGYAGLGSLKPTFVKKNEQAPPNPAGAPAGLAWYTVEQTDPQGHVVAYQMTENAQPPMSDRERLALTLGLMLPSDAHQTSLNGNTCEVWESQTLKRITGSAYAAATTTSGTSMADMRVESSPAC